MELYTGTPYWPVKNKLWDYFNPLKENLSVDVVIVGAGITGALVAHEMLRYGIDCCVVDKRTPGLGSSSASTALLQYEIDVPLCRMAEMMPEKDAVLAYRSCLEAIGDLEELLASTGVDGGFLRVPSVQYADSRRALHTIRREYEIRRKHALPVVYFDSDELKRKMRIDARGALVNTVSAQIDTYKAATGLLRHDIERSALRLYSHTEITGRRRQDDGYVLTTSEGYRIDCKRLVIASGFEAGEFLHGRPMELTTTFAIASEPVDPSRLWIGRSLIWQMRDPYLYIRTDGNRIIVGGEDVRTNDSERRRLLLPEKAAVLERKFRRLYPDIPFRREFAWAGTFSTTRDGLPLIGAAERDPHMLFALGYGGNGITFSRIAARILAKKVIGRVDAAAHVFRIDRPSL